MKQNLRIAIPGYAEETEHYFSALRHFGAEPVIVTEPCTEGFDGLLLPGGGDIAPHFFGEENLGSREIDEPLDQLQLDACRAFYLAGKPVLGICKGVQVINVCFGGTIVQDLPTAAQHLPPAPHTDNVHANTAAEGSILHALYGASFPTNSTHHQAVNVPGEGLRATQWAEDGTIEAIEHDSAPIFGVQWHPERICFEGLREDTVDGSRVLQHFLELC